MDAGAGPSDATERKVKELTERLSRLEGMSGAGAGASEITDVDLRQQLQQTLARLREIRAALGTTSGEEAAGKAVSEEAEKLQAALRKKDYRILHLTRALDAMSAGKSGSSGSS